MRQPFHFILEMKFSPLELRYFLTIDGRSGEMRLYFFFKGLASTFQFNDMTFN